MRPVAPHPSWWYICLISHATASLKSHHQLASGCIFAQMPAWTQLPSGRLFTGPLPPKDLTDIRGPNVRVGDRRWRPHQAIVKIKPHDGVSNKPFLFAHMPLRKSHHHWAPKHIPFGPWTLSLRSFVFWNQMAYSISVDTFQQHRHQATCLWVLGNRTEFCFIWRFSGAVNGMTIEPRIKFARYRKREKSKAARLKPKTGLEFAFQFPAVPDFLAKWYQTKSKFTLE